MQTVTRKLEPNTKGDGIVYTPALLWTITEHAANPFLLVSNFVHS